MPWVRLLMRLQKPFTFLNFLNLAQNMSLPKVISQIEQQNTQLCLFCQFFTYIRFFEEMHLKGRSWQVKQMRMQRSKAITTAKQTDVMMEVWAIGNKYGDILGWMSWRYVEDRPGMPYKRAPVTITQRSDRAKALSSLENIRWKKNEAFVKKMGVLFNIHMVSSQQFFI